MNELKMEQQLYLRLLNGAQTGNVELFRSVQKQIATDTKLQWFSWKKCIHPKSGDTLLHLACRHGHYKVLRFLCKEVQGFDYEQGNMNGKRPLHEAAQASQQECLDYLLTHEGINVNCLKKADWTPLMLSCTKRHLDIVKSLVAHGSNLRLRNKDGWTCFHIACREGDLNIVSFLLDCDFEIWNSVSKNGRTPLHTAVLHRQVDVVRLLLEKTQCKVDVTDNCGTTPLMDAFRVDSIDIAYLLLEREANISAIDKLQRTMLHIASEAGNTESIRHLIENYLLDVNQCAADGTTPLHLACKEGQTDAVTLLLNLGAQVNATDGKKRTALHMTCSGQHLECTRVLLRSGINVDHLNYNGEAAASLAKTASLKHLLASYTKQTNIN